MENLSSAAGSLTLPPFFQPNKVAGKYKSLHTIDELFADHDHRICVVVGSGPSLRGFDFSHLNRSKFFTMAINDEIVRNVDQYRPDMWIFNDENVMLRYKEIEIDRRIAIVSRQINVHQHIHRAHQHGVMPNWIHRVYEYQNTSQWRPAGSLLYMSRTTASASLCLAYKMGFKKVILLGVDFFTDPQSYYYTGDTKPRNNPKRAKTVIGEHGEYMEDRHVRMVMDMTHVKERLESAGYRGVVIQTSLRSPLSCFPKMSFSQAVHHEAN